MKHMKNLLNNNFLNLVTYSLAQNNDAKQFRPCSPSYESRILLTDDVCLRVLMLPELLQI